MAATEAPAGSIPTGLRVLHVLNRLSFGPAPGDIDRVKRIGVDHYIREQLHPDSIPEPDHLVREIAALKTLDMNPVELFRKYQMPRAPARKSSEAARGATPADPFTNVDPAAVAAERRRRSVLEQAVTARLIRAIEGPRQLQEVMANFWFNHFNVFAGKGPDLIWVGAYEQQAIRPHALGRFRDLLDATARHPAMLFYLDNCQNTAPGSPGARGKEQGINENYARELMELHTLGVDGGYTQQDVVALARILTGWGFARPQRDWRIRPRRGGRGPLNMFQYSMESRELIASATDGFFFDASRHDFTAKTFLGHTIGGSGIGEGKQALDILSRSPATAHHLSYQLAQYFVSDDPPPPLVKALAARFLDSDGDIRAVLASLFDSPQFWERRYYGAKFKSPYQFVISAVRAAGMRVSNFRPLAGMMGQLGMPLYGCQTPDGYKNTQDAWLNPDAMMRRLDFASALGAGRVRLQAPPPDEPGVGANGAIKPFTPIAPEPADAVILAANLGGHFSDQTASAIETAPESLRAAVIFGSPEFMRR